MARLRPYLVGASVALCMVAVPAGVLFGIFHWSLSKQATPSNFVDKDPSLGPQNAPVTVVEFIDYQCPYCRSYANATLPLIFATYRDRIHYVSMDFPLVSIHPQSERAAEAAQCAFDQGKFWEYRNMLFGNQSALGNVSLKSYGAQLDLNQKAFNTCLDSGKYASAVQQDISYSLTQGVSGVPTFFINGRKLVGAQPFSMFQQIIDEELAKAGVK